MHDGELPSQMSANLQGAAQHRDGAADRWANRSIAIASGASLLERTVADIVDAPPDAEAGRRAPSTGGQHGADRGRRAAARQKQALARGRAEARTRAS